MLFVYLYILLHREDTDVCDRYQSDLGRVLKNGKSTAKRCIVDKSNIPIFLLAVRGFYLLASLILLQRIFPKLRRKVRGKLPLWILLWILLTIVFWFFRRRREQPEVGVQKTRCRRLCEPGGQISCMSGDTICWSI